MLRELDRPDGPAGAPARHRVRLGEARDRHDAVVDARQRERARVLGVERQIGVHLVAYEPQVVPAADLADGGDLGRRHHGARRVVRRREQHGPGARRDGSLDIVRLEMEPSLGQQRDVDDPRARRSQHRLVGDVGGLGDDDLVPRVEDALADGVERRSGRPGSTRRARSRSRFRRSGPRGGRSPRAGSRARPSACSACDRRAANGPPVRRSPAVCRCRSRRCSAGSRRRPARCGAWRDRGPPRRRHRYRECDQSATRSARPHCTGGRRDELRDGGCREPPLTPQPRGPAGRARWRDGACTPPSRPGRPGGSRPSDARAAASACDAPCASASSTPRARTAVGATPTSPTRQPCGPCDTAAPTSAQSIARRLNLT